MRLEDRVSPVGDETTREPAFQCYCGPAYPRTILVPRSVFFESRLYAYLNASNPVAPLDKLAFRQNLTSASSNSDELQHILTGNVTTSDVQAILDLLTRNGTNALVHVTLSLTNDLFLYSLPDGAVCLVGFGPPPTAYSWTYSFAGGGTTSAPWWELVWNGIVSTVTSLVTSAVVLALTSFAKLVEVLAQVGAWLWSAIVNAPATVASAVQAAGEALGQFVDWIIESALSLFRAGLPALDIRMIVNGLSLPIIPPDGTGLDPAVIGRFVSTIFSGWFFYLMVGVGLLLQLVSTYLAIQSFGTALVASHLIAPKIVEILVQAWLKTVLTIAVSLAITASIAGLLYLVLPSADPFWREGLGLSFISVALAVEKAPQIVKGFRADPSGIAKELAGFAIAVIGLIIALIASGVSGAFWGFIFAAAGAAITLFNKDVFDWSPTSPLKNVEEIMSVVSLSYATANLAREVLT